MGTYVIGVRAVGGHGCQREVKSGDVVTGCGQPSCPDCNAREFVKKLLATGQSQVEATLTHWPGDAGTVVDNLVSGKRLGSF